MRTNATKTINCDDCEQEFETKRIDRRICKACSRKRRAVYMRNWSRRPENVARVAELRKELRQKVIDAYGGCCACCGETRFEFLAIDHVNGGGRKEREVLSSWQLVNKVYKLDCPPEYQILCHNCNSAKGWWGFCPHERERVS